VKMINMMYLIGKRLLVKVYATFIFQLASMSIGKYQNLLN